MFSFFIWLLFVDFLIKNNYMGIKRKKKNVFVKYSRNINFFVDINDPGSS